MMRYGFSLLLGLVGVLLAVPSPAPAGPGCSSGYYSQGYGLQYSYPVQYSAPVSYATPTTYYTPAVSYQQSYQNDVIYRIAPDLAAARLAQEASEMTLAKFQAMLKQQAAEAEARSDKQANREFQMQVIQLLSQRGTPPPVYGSAATPQTASLPPDVLQAFQQLQAENASLRAALEKSAPPVPAPPKLESPPPIPPAGGPPSPKAQGGPAASAAEVARKAVADKRSGCLDCHGPNSPKKLTDLSDPAKLSYEKLTDCVNRMISSDPEFVMPKGKPPGTAPAEMVGAFHDLSRAARK